MSSDEAAGAPLIAVRVELTVISEVDGRVGNETMTARMRFPAVPRIDDWVELGRGESARQVKVVIFRDGEEPLVRLWQVVTDDPERLDELAHLIRTRRWECPGWKLGGLP